MFLSNTPHGLNARSSSLIFLDKLLSKVTRLNFFQNALHFDLGVLCLSTSERVLILLEGDVVILQDVGDLLGLRSLDDLLLEVLTVRAVVVAWAYLGCVSLGFEV